MSSVVRILTVCSQPWRYLPGTCIGPPYRCRSSHHPGRYRTRHTHLRDDWGGSGVVISADGLMLTNHHVIDAFYQAEAGKATRH